MTVRTDLANRIKLLATSKQSITDATTTAFDFGTPNDINLAALSDYDPGDRILIVMDASTAGTTSTLTLVVQDADDNAGSIGTPATADTDGTLAGGTGDAFLFASVNLKAGRPWLRIALTQVDATDTFQAHCSVFAIPRGLV